MRYVALTDEEISLLRERIRKSVSNTKNAERKRLLTIILEKLKTAPDESTVLASAPFRELWDNEFDRCWDDA